MYRMEITHLNKLISTLRQKVGNAIIEDDFFEKIKEEFLPDTKIVVIPLDDNGKFMVAYLTYAEQDRLSPVLQIILSEDETGLVTLEDFRYAIEGD